MNSSNYPKSNQSKTSSSSSSSSLNNFNFDFDLGISSSNRPKSLNDHKTPNPSSFSSSSYSAPSSQPRPAWQPNKPSWTHQPAPAKSTPTPTGLPGGPVSMVGDIFGKTWGSTPTQSSTTTATPIGIINKNPNLFGDLVTSALGQPSNKISSSNVPLKNATPTSSNNKSTSSFSMGHVADSLPKPHTSSSWGSSGNFASVKPNVGAAPSINSVSGISSKKDPFSSLGVGIGSNKPPATLNSSAQKQPVKNESVSVDDGFGDFQNASKPTSAAAAAANAFPSSGGSGIDIDFSGFAAAGSNQSTPVKAGSGGGGGGDPMDMFFSASSASVSAGAGGQASSGMDDWGLDSDGFGGHDDAGSTTELEGLPPPPAGISGSTAKGKGMDSYKQGQFADAIKWLSWAVILLEKTGDNAASAEVLSSRASCYKEVGEYKKAVADCTKVLENDETNVSVLVQRALLYESMEKYKLGAEDLRTVLRIDPGNRIAKSTVHRLAKMAE